MATYQKTRQDIESSARLKAAILQSMTPGREYTTNDLMHICPAVKEMTTKAVGHQMTALVKLGFVRFHRFHESKGKGHTTAWRRVE